MSILKAVKIALFTNRCKLCGDVIEVDEELCSECKSSPDITGECCSSCGCSKEDCVCKKNKNEFKAVVAPFYYEDKLIQSIHRFKENDMTFLSDYLSEKMAETVSERYSDIRFDMITYVPTGELKERQRGFNQSKLLADKLSKELDIPCEELLYKRRHTGTLHKNKSKRKRSSIVFGAFDVYEDCRELIKDKTILIVDDVKTTGSTLNECSKMLNIYGAKAVYAVTAAIMRRKNKIKK